MELFLIRIDDGVELTKPSVDDLGGAAAASLPLTWRLGDLGTWLYLGSLGRRRAQDEILRYGVLVSIYWTRLDSCVTRFAVHTSVDGIRRGAGTRLPVAQTFSVSILEQVNVRSGG